MNDKEQLISKVRDEFNQWEELLGGMNEEQITAPDLPGNWSIKDVMAHLMEWQKVSIARMEVFRLETEPVYPGWLKVVSPESDEDTEKFNARIFEAHDEEPWSSVWQTWRNGFLHFVELGESIPEKDLMAEGKYPWLNGYALFAVLKGSYDHHVEHREELLVWLDNQ